ncbi:MAG: hypothetical protein PHI23_04645 [Candidatus Peribacteraceae bacterium]|nr:hypothetical protein [Candidatus Peribacteraceae bacterium]
MAKKKSRTKKSKKTLKRKVKKTRKVMKRKAARKPAKRKAAKKVTKKKVTKKKAKAKLSPAKKALIRKTAETVLGKITHFYDRIGVGVVALDAPLKIGQTIRLKHGAREFTQKVSSMQVNHTPIATAKKGEEIGLKLDKEATEGTLVLAA